MSEFLDQLTDPMGLIALACLSLASGLSLKLSDLIQEHGYSWFRGAALATGCLAAIFAVAMLSMGGADLQHLWLAVLLSWIVRGRIDGINHGVMAAAIIGFYLLQTPQMVTKPELAIYFLGILLPLGLLHDALQYTQISAPRFLRWFFRNQHLYWYLLGIGYLVFFSRNLEVPVNIYAFVKGYGFLYHGKRDRLLSRSGIKCPDSQIRSAGELIGEESPKKEVHPTERSVGE